MPSKRLPTDFELEELLKLVTETPVDDAVAILELNDVVLFLSTYDITPGPNLVLHRLIYRLYRLWSKQPLTHQQFTQEMVKYLISYEKRDQWYYLINTAAFKLSAKAYELLKAQTVNKTKSKNYKRHFEAFLKFHGLTPGTLWLESYLIFYLYDLWANKKPKPLGEKQFHKFAKLYFKHKRRSDSQVEWYAVDESVLRFLPQEHIDQIRQSRKRKNGKEKNKKERSKIPSTPSGT